MCKKIHRGGNAEQYHANKKYKEAVAEAVEARDLATRFGAVTAGSSKRSPVLGSMSGARRRHSSRAEAS